MNTSKHTPGPWRLSEENNVWSESGERVANVIQGQKGNAHLIAAAPELLAALLEIETRWDRGDFSRETRVWMQMRDAITKAIGKSPLD